jgi:hypothetical protein
MSFSQASLQNVNNVVILNAVVYEALLWYQPEIIVSSNGTAGRMSEN